MQRRSEELVPGLWSLPVALSSSGLGTVFSYALEVDAGLVLVDLGMGNDESRASLEAHLADIGASLSDVQGVLFTHVHPDHYGLAGAVRERSGAWLALHPAEIPFLQGRRRRPDFVEELSAETGLEFGHHSGAAAYDPGLQAVMPDRTLSDNELIEIGRWRIRVIHTPGHSAGHCCFVIEDAGMMILGDHVLSRTTPNVSHWPWSDGDPLGDYLQSLRRIANLGAGHLGLPGHEDRIIDIPARAEELIAHHREQLAAVTELVEGGHETIGDVAQRMRWSRAWPDLGYVDRVMAVGEATAHLRTLERRGEIRRGQGLPVRFSTA